MGKSKPKWKKKMELTQYDQKMDDSGQSTADSKMPDETFIEKLLKKADSLVETFEYNLAKQFYKRALEQNPNHLQAVEALASVHLDLGEIDEAEQHLLRAVSLCPDEGHRKYFSLAQLNSNKEALEFYSKGIAVIESQANGCVTIGTCSQNEDYKTKRDLSNAYCAVAEIFMTDCCYEENAEAECKSCIEKAILSDQENPEALQCLANYQLVKDDVEEAKRSMEKSLSLWLPSYRESRESINQQENEIFPMSFESRVSTSKLLIELEMFDEATEILDGLIEENDEEMNTWYMLGVLNHLRGADYHGNARFYLKKAQEVGKKTPESDEEIMLHIVQLLTEVGCGSDDEESDDNKENLVENSDEEYETMSEEEVEMN